MGAKSEETQVKSGKVCFIFQNKKQCLVAILIIALGLVIVVAGALWNFLINGQLRAIFLVHRRDSGN